MALFYTPHPSRYPDAGKDIPRAVIRGLAQSLPGDTTVLVGANIDDDKDKVEVDLIIISTHAVHVVEVKNYYRWPLIVTPNGPWYEELDPGGRRLIRGTLRGGHRFMPDAQAKYAAEVIARAYGQHGVRVYPYVLIPDPHPDSRIPPSHGAWARIVDGFDELLPNLRQ
jgi:hypothetical protein